MTARQVVIPPLKVEDHNEKESWKKFLRRFQIAVIGKTFLNKDEDLEGEEKERVESHRKGAMLLNCIGEQGMEIFDTFGVEVTNIQYEDLERRFEEFFTRRENKILLRHRMLVCEQKDEEDVTGFIERVTKMAGQCQFGALKEDMIMQVVIKGMKDDKLRNDLLVKADLTLDELKATCLRYESADRTAMELKDRKFRDGEVEQASEEGRCFRCRQTGHFARECPQEPSCYSCGERGHMSVACPTKRAGREVICYKCGERGHIVSSCPQNRFRSGNTRGRLGNNRTQGWRRVGGGRGQPNLGRGHGYEVKDKEFGTWEEVRETGVLNESL